MSISTLSSTVVLSPTSHDLMERDQDWCAQYAQQYVVYLEHWDYNPYGLPVLERQVLFAGPDLEQRRDVSGPPLLPASMAPTESCSALQAPITRNSTTIRERTGIWAVRVAGIESVPGFAKPHPGLYCDALPGLGRCRSSTQTIEHPALEGRCSKAQGEALRTLGILIEEIDSMRPSQFTIAVALLWDAPVLFPPSRVPILAIICSEHRPFSRRWNRN